MTNIIKILIVPLFIMPIILYGGQNEDVYYDFNHEDNCYAFRGSFIVKADAECAVNMLFDIDHLPKYTVGAKSVELIHQGDNWYDVTYTYRKWIIIEHKSTWRRTLKRKDNKIVFELISSKNNINLVPEMHASTGYYKISTAQNGCRVEYYQECTLKSGILKSAYISKMLKEAIVFLKVLKQYVSETCN